MKNQSFRSRRGFKGMNRVTNLIVRVNQVQDQDLYTSKSATLPKSIEKEKEKGKENHHINQKDSPQEALNNNPHKNNTSIMKSNSSNRRNT